MRRGINTRWQCVKSLLPIARKLSWCDRLKMLGRPLISPLPFILNYINPKDKLFDIGCGSGALLHLAVKHANVDIADGCEISDSLLSNITKLDHPFHVTNVIKITIDDPLPPLEDYTLVTAIDVLHHVMPEKQQFFLEEITSNTKSGTRLILADINADKSIGAFLNRIHDLMLAKQLVYPWSPSKVAYHLTRLGWNIKHHTHHRNLWYPHYVIVAEK